MTTSKRTTEYFSNYHVLLFAKLLLVTIILFWLAPLTNSKPQSVRKRRRSKRNSYQRQINRIRRDCEDDCLQVYHVQEEAMNCILQCVSPDCFQDLFQDGPLEPGEIQTEKALQLQSCAKEELKEARRQEKERAKQQEK
jgi:hypothetical protein